MRVKQKMRIYKCITRSTSLERADRTFSVAVAAAMAEIIRGASIRRVRALQAFTALAAVASRARSLSKNQKGAELKGEIGERVIIIIIMPERI